MFKVTAYENRQIGIEIVKEITRETFRRLEYAEGREYAILNLRQWEREAREYGDDRRQTAYCNILWEIATNKL